MTDPDRADRVRVCDCPEYRYRVCDVCQSVTGVEVADQREIPADELAEAERSVRELRDVGLLVDKAALARYMAEYDVRGRERDAARAEIERLLEKSGMERKQWIAARAELERLHARMVELVAEFRKKSAEFLEDWQDWDSHDGHERCGQGIAYSDAADALDALARAHEDEGDVK